MYERRADALLPTREVSCSILHTRANMNAEVNRMVSVLLTLVNDTELSCYWTPADTRELQARCKAEGMSFLTTTLPRLAKALQRSFAEGAFYPVEGFKCKRGNVYPMFMQKAWAMLIQDGVWEDINGDKFGLPIEDLVGVEIPPLVRGSSHVLAGAVKAIRQVSLMYYKTILPYSADQVKAVTETFKASEAELADLDLSVGSAQRDRLITKTDYDTGWTCSISVDSVLTRARRYVCHLLSGFDPKEIRPRHGSGASACRTEPWERYRNPRFIPKLDAVYPYGDWFFLSHGVDCRENEKLHNLVVEEEPMARVVFVPKDSRGPRLISTEPKEYMYIQQGLMDLLYRAIDTYPLVKAQLDCRDQTRNQRLARWGSETGAVATLDLKEASDRVSMTLVEALFPEYWVECFKACRSTRTRLPNGEVVTFRKFAPMGSAVCFPVEAICFWALALAANPLNEFSIENMFSATPRGLESNQLAVFGDDIIIPTGVASYYIDILSSVGLTVNHDKCFRQGPFRESCGRDFFLGEDVSIVKCGHVPRVSGGRMVMDQVRFRTADWFNNLIIRYGTYHLTDPLLALFREWYGDIVVSSRVTTPTDEFQRAQTAGRGLVLLAGVYDWPAEGRTVEYLSPNQRARKFDRRWNHELFRLEIYNLIELPVVMEVDTDDWSHLLRILLNGSNEKAAHLWTLAKRCRYKYGWTVV